MDMDVMVSGHVLRLDSARSGTLAAGRIFWHGRLRKDLFVSSYRLTFVTVIAALILAYLWLLTNSRAHETLLTWGGAVLAALLLYVVWGSLERRLRRQVPQVRAEAPSDWLRLLIERSPGGWQWLRVATVAYAGGALNAVLMNNFRS
jgi:hypothetical protein